MSLYDIPLRTLSGQPTSLADHKGRAVLVVNVASKLLSDAEDVHEGDVLVVDGAG